MFNTALTLLTLWAPVHAETVTPVPAAHHCGHAWCGPPPGSSNGYWSLRAHGEQGVGVLVTPIDGVWVATAVGFAGTTALLPRPEGNGELSGAQTQVVDVLGFSYTAFEPTREWSVVSDTMLYGNIGLALLVPHHFGQGGGRQSLGRMAIQAESIGFTLVATELVKRIAARPRPWTTLPEDARAYADGGAARQPDSEAYISFPSGHTALVAASTFSTATMFTLEYPELKRKPWACVGLFGAASAVTGVTAYARVASNARYASDVVGGAVLGIGFGVGVPLLHTLWPGEPAERGEVAVTVAVMPGYLALAGQW